MLSLLGLFVPLNINLHNIHPNLQLYCQDWVHKVLQVLSWDRNQGAHLSGPRCSLCHLVGEGSTVFMSSSSRRACLKVRISCLWRTAIYLSAQDSTPPLFWLYALPPSCPNPVLRNIFFQISPPRLQWMVDGKSLTSNKPITLCNLLPLFLVQTSTPNGAKGKTGYPSKMMELKIGTWESWLAIWSMPGRNPLREWRQYVVWWIVSKKCPQWHFSSHMLFQNLATPHQEVEFMTVPIP